MCLRSRCKLCDPAHGNLNWDDLSITMSMSNEQLPHFPRPGYATLLLRALNSA